MRRRNRVDDDWCADGCVVSTCDDGIQNGDETGIDAGGYCSAPPRDICRRAEVVPLDPYGVVGNTVELFTAVSGTFDEASSVRTPSCGTDGRDQAFRFEVQVPTALQFEAFTHDNVNPDVVQPVSVSVTRGCDGPEIACGFADRGPFGAGTPNLTLDPGEYIVWVDGDPEGRARSYELFVYGERDLE